MGTRIAVYGTLKKGWGNHRLIKNSKFVGVGKTKNKYAMYGSGIPYVTDKEEDTEIHVEVYELDEPTLKSVDRLEGHPEWYQRKAIPIVLENGSETEAELYFNDTFSKKYTKKIESGKF